ncbi:hypothetical protein J31TS4_14510 [Paenibacillus sp. J31TS4]|nr:hypothetical protein J31TS4_14510 [Paenibacillus sp. J31TS4]
MRIQFQELRVGTVAGSSGVFHGRNSQRGMKHVAKQNQAFGTVNGERVVLADIQAMMEDDDRIDLHSLFTPPKT